MKTSNYSVLMPAGKNYILYNCRTDVMVQVDNRLAELYQKNETDLERIADAAPDFFEYLSSNGFIVEDDFDEQKQIIDYWKEDDENSEELLVTINPTMNCNLRCWYCYEEHGKKSKMEQSTVDAVISYLQKQVAGGRFKSIALTFFGGEPLLYFSQVVQPILEQIKKIGTDKVNWTLHFTTNATLLTKEIAEYLQPWYPSFQITIDGNEFIHNIVKTMGKNKPGTYRMTIGHIRMLLQMRMKVAIRFNYTAKTLERFIDVLTDLKDFSDEEREYCNVAFFRVWQDKKSDDEKSLEEKLDFLESAFRSAGFHVIGQTTRLVGRCYADRDNSIVINYDGMVYKCTAREFNQKNCEGRLMEDGNIEWNSRYEQRRQVRYCNETCRSCILLALCHGGCSQNKLESPEVGCLMGYSEEDKMDYIRQRIKDIYVEQTKRVEARKRKDQS